MERFWNRAHSLIPKDTDLLLGDFNLTLRPQDTTSTSKHLRPKAALSSLLDTLGFVDPAHESALHTFVGNSPSRRFSARLDHLYSLMDSPLCPCLLPTPNHGLSDHAPVRWSINTSLALSRSPIWKWTPSRLTPEALLATSLLVDELPSHPTVGEWDSFKRSVRAVSRSFPPPVLPAAPEGDITCGTLLEAVERDAHTVRVSADVAQELPSKYLSSWAKARRGATAFNLLCKCEA